MERSGDFSGTFRETMEECRSRCGKVQELLSIATKDDESASPSSDSHTEEAFVQAQEEAAQVKDFLEGISSSLLAVSTEDNSGEEREATDTLERLNAVIAELTLEEEEAEAAAQNEGFGD